MLDNQILLVDDEKGMRDALGRILKREGYSVISASNGAEAINKIKNYNPALTLLDIKMPGMDGMETLSEIRKFDDESIVVMLTAYGTIESAVKATKLGIYDYVTKPFKQDRIMKVVCDALKVIKCSVKGQDRKIDRFGKIIGAGSKMQRIYNLFKKSAPTDITVLLRGKSGTGKEMAARAIHNNSLRKKGPFIAIDIASLPETLVESELFGHEKGAYTGADARKLGKFEMAQGGTVFLDEIGNLSMVQQAKLLRVIEERKIERIGSREKIDLDIRLIVATNADLEEAVRNGIFREDLYYRINVFPVTMPFLKERKEDIPLLVEHFLCEARKKYNKNVRKVSSEAMETLMGYEWPGNVRELKNIIESAALLADEIIKTENLPLAIRERCSGQQGISTLKGTTRQIEKETILKILKENNWNKSMTAKLLQIDYKTLYNKIKLYRIKREEC